MFVLVPPNDQPTMKLIERAVEPIRERFVGHETILLLILEVEGNGQPRTYFAHDMLLEKISGVEDEAQEKAAEVVKIDMSMFGTTALYFCTVVEYLPRAKKYARAVTGVLGQQKRSMN